MQEQQNIETTEAPARDLYSDDLSQSEYETLRSGGELVNEATSEESDLGNEKEEKPVSEKDENELDNSEDQENDSEDEPEEDENDEEEEKPKKRKSGFKKRIDRFNKRLSEKDLEIERLKLELQNAQRNEPQEKEVEKADEKPQRPSEA